MVLILNSLVLLHAVMFSFIIHNSKADISTAEQIQEETTKAVEAANRWTDNIFSVQDWVKKKYPGFPQVPFFRVSLKKHFISSNFF
jgi:hypothetical protein